MWIVGLQADTDCRFFRPSGVVINNAILFGLAVRHEADILLHSDNRVEWIRADLQRLTATVYVSASGYCNNGAEYDYCAVVHGFCHRPSSGSRSASKV